MLRADRAMNEGLLAQLLQNLSHLQAEIHYLLLRQGMLEVTQAIHQGFTLNQPENEEAPPLILKRIHNRGDVRIALEREQRGCSDMHDWQDLLRRGAGNSNLADHHLQFPLEVTPNPCCLKGPGRPILAGLQLLNAIAPTPQSCAGRDRA